jgi:hypothetical protein
MEVTAKCKLKMNLKICFSTPNSTALKPKISGSAKTSREPEMKESPSLSQALLLLFFWLVLFVCGSTARTKK